MYSILTSKITDNIKCVISEAETTADETVHIPSHEDIMTDMVLLKLDVLTLKKEMAELNVFVTDANIYAYNKHRVMQTLSDVMNTSTCVVAYGILGLSSMHCIIAFINWSDRRMRL